jgi:glycosyltransferase involved in cell wall biosynthesis
VFESLLHQEFRDFEWLIIDDGSSDDTCAVIEEFIKESSFKINYYYQENSHKFLTLLKAAQLACGEFFYSIDSDDEIFPFTLKVLNETWESIPLEYRHQYSGVTGLCVDQFGQLVGMDFPSSPFDSDTLESTVKYKIKGEKSGFQRTDVLREFSFDDTYKSNGYIPEGILWISLANKGYKTRYVNEVFRKYYINDGVSIMTTAKFADNAYGTFQYTCLFLNSYRIYFLNNLILLLGQSRNYLVSGWILNKSTLSLVKLQNYLIIKLILIVIWPISLIYFIKIKKN